MVRVVEARMNYSLESQFVLGSIRWALVILFLLIWEGGAQLGVIDTYYFSNPIDIASNVYTWGLQGMLGEHLFVTLSQAAVGFLVGLVLGTLLGFLFAINKTVDEVLQPFIVVMNAMPRIAFAPLIILWFGLGFLSKVVIVVSLVFFVVFFNTYRGFKEINPILLKNARVLGASKKQVIQHVYFPAALSWIFASLRVSVGFAVIASVLGEYIGASAGIGYLIDNAQSNFDATGVMSGLAILTIVVAVIDYFLQKVERRYSAWNDLAEIRGGI
ncbi:MAG: ABC transporter permease [Candidatus Thiodiazotropha endolucinida]|nr:ABC transporter permease [Candidatus Thiodiazotropha endolucinida]MCG8094264.1 ABC transporter permease [Candidatus Thiodiazotropha endolucinida]MCW4228155.1 ABC transporter permease [Candidatus Thiodiazotropha taylori]